LWDILEHRCTTWGTAQRGLGGSASHPASWDIKSLPRVDCDKTLRNPLELPSEELANI